MSRVLALVTARGGSKGFPGKNLALLGGRPLVAWAYRTLAIVRDRWQGELILRLSTDDPAIAAAWPSEDRPTRLRPMHLATDEATSLDVVRHELAMTDAEGSPCESLLLLQPTSPLLNEEDLLGLLAAMTAGASSAVCVTAVNHPPQWSLVIKEGRVEPLLGGLAHLRRQEQPPTWLPCGAWWCTRKQLESEHALVVPGKTHAVVVPSERATDIDHALDLVDATARLPGYRRASTISIGDRLVGGGAPCLIIAEAGVNHDGDPAEAHRLIDAAKAAGADCVKFQIFHADSLAAHDAPTADYQKRAGFTGNQHSMLRRLELPTSVWSELQAHANESGILFLCSPFDEGSADLLAGLGVPAFKLGSGELTNAFLLRHVASFGKPLLLSTGMADLEECQAAETLVRAAGASQIAWLHCVSQYPAPATAANLRSIATLRAVLGGPIGWSDHSTGSELTIAAIAQGADLIERHLTRDRSRPGPDHAASLDPCGFATMVTSVRAIQVALGDGIKRRQECEGDVARVARRSLTSVRALPSGTLLTADDLTARRPGTGLNPILVDRLVGRRLKSAVAAGEMLRWDHLQ